MDVENRIVVRSYYSHYEMKVIFEEMFKKILGVISEQEVIRLFNALAQAQTEEEIPAQWPDARIAQRLPDSHLFAQRLVSDAHDASHAVRDAF